VLTPRVTLHVVPAGRPVSVKVTVNVAADTGDAKTMRATRTAAVARIA